MRRAAAKTRRKRPEADIQKKRSRHLDGVTEVDPQDYELMRKFVTEHGKIIPARLTGANAKQQRQIKRGVRRAREIGILA